MVPRLIASAFRRRTGLRLYEHLDRTHYWSAQIRLPYECVRNRQRWHSAPESLGLAHEVLLGRDYRLLGQARMECDHFVLPSVRYISRPGPHRIPCSCGFHTTLGYGAAHRFKHLV